MIKKIEKSIPWLIILTIGIMVLFGTGIVLKEVVADDWTTEVEVAVNATPTVGTVILNGGSDITLTESVTTTVQATTTVTDTDGYSDISSVIGKIYRSGVGTGCSDDDNNCYSDSSCVTSSPSGNSYTATCEYEVWFHADPTDTGSPWVSEYWDAWIKAIDSAYASSSATSSGVEMNTLNALDLSTTSIDYGTLGPGQDTGTLNQITTATTTGNAAIDIYLYGTDLYKDYWAIATSSAAFEFDLTLCTAPAIAQIDTTHYLVPYEGPDVDGWATVLEVNTSTWAIDTPSAAFEFDSDTGYTPAINQIDTTHYLVPYSGYFAAGRSVVLEVNTSSWAINTSSATFEFNPSPNVSNEPAIVQIDTTHYLVPYRGPNSDGWAIVLGVNTSTWAITTSSAPFEFDEDNGHTPAIAQIDTTHYLVSYRGPDNDGWATVLEVNTSTWAIDTPSAAFEFDSDTGYTPAINQIDTTHYLVSYEGTSTDGWSVVLNVNTSTWAITTSSAAFEFDPSQGGAPAIAQIDTTHYLAPYGGPDADGWSVVLDITEGVEIPVENQEYATGSGTSYGSGTDATELTDNEVDLDLSKPTSHPSTSSDDVYWGVGIPSGQELGTYTGTTTYEAKSSP